MKMCSRERTKNTVVLTGTTQNCKGRDSFQENRIIEKIFIWTLFLLPGEGIYARYFRFIDFKRNWSS